MDGYRSLVSFREGGCLTKPRMIFACFRPMTVLVLSSAPSSPHALLPAAGQPRVDAPQATIGPGSAGHPVPTALDGACVAGHHPRSDRRAQHAPAARGNTRSLRSRCRIPASDAALERHAPRTARRAELAPLAAERQQRVVATLAAAQSQESVRQDAALQKFTVIFTVKVRSTSIGAGLRAILRRLTFRDLSRTIDYWVARERFTGAST
jgi:hypothetical protein